MKYRAAGVIETIAGERDKAQEVLVRLDSGELRRALSYTELVGRVAVGDTVSLNIVAIELGLGTGGYDFVVSGDLSEREVSGHLLKLRYTPLQLPVLAVEAPESPHHAALAAFKHLADLPVVCMELHSQLPAVCAAAQWAFGRRFGVPPKIVYIMTDGAALPLAFSRTTAQLQERNLLAATITAGQAFGGDYEAITLFSALAAAKTVLNADLVCVGQGPGNAGTGTPLGFSGIEAGAALNAAESLGGTPIFAPRISFADARERHYGLSHHSETILTRIALRPALVPIPRLPEAEYRLILNALRDAGIFDFHSVMSVEAEEGLAALEETGLDVATMGRGISQERAFFLASAAAGIVAAQRANG